MTKQPNRTIRPNRLKLDWALSTSAERKQFVDSYMNSISFSPTEEELETIANYLLFGKDEDGLNCTQRKEIQIETRKKTWTKEDEMESLDALVETATFNEAAVRVPTKSAQLKVKREIFDREKALRECPVAMRDVFLELFHRIDILDFQIETFEFNHGKRTEPPREQLREALSQEDQDFFGEKTQKWNQFFYLKQRHQLVEMRREQFTLRDQYKEKVLRHCLPEPEGPILTPQMGADVLVMPLGLKCAGTLSKIFGKIEDLHPKAFTEEEQKKAIDFYWEQQKEFAENPKMWFDFRELEHVYELLKLLEEMRDDVLEDTNSTLGDFLRTLEFYMGLSNLTEVQKEILELKIHKTKNQDIANHINKKHNMSYTANYISTIFRQKIIPRINDAARLHQNIVENICFAENFKKCGGCGRMLLLHSDNFVRRARSNDGFAQKCKECDKKDRQRRKNEVKKL